MLHPTSSPCILILRFKHGKKALLYVKCPENKQLDAMTKLGLKGAFLNNCSHRAT